MRRLARDVLMMALATGASRVLGLFRDVAIADRYRDRLKELYGPERGAKIRHAEALEICEYGAPLAPADIPTLFPFFSR